MVYKLGRVLQFVGLVLLPIAMAGNLARPDAFGLWFTLGLSSVGIAVFSLGYWLQQVSKPQ